GTRGINRMSLVNADRAEGVAIVSLNDPERRNVLSLPMVEEIVAAFDALETDASVGAVVVTGAPPAFCAGADLGDLGRGGEAGDGGSVTTVYDGFLRVARSTLPTAAAVNGPAWRCVDDADLIAEATAFAAGAAGAPRDLAIKAKETLEAVAGLDEHNEAVAVELTAQRWSFGQPFFAERLAAMRERV